MVEAEKIYYPVCYWKRLSTCHNGLLFACSKEKITDKNCIQKQPICTDRIHKKDIDLEINMIDSTH